MGRKTEVSELESEAQPVYFNIFDGTNATGEFADFVFDGDSDDENADFQETQRWEAAQDHI